MLSVEDALGALHYSVDLEVDLFVGEDGDGAGDFYEESDSLLPSKMVGIVVEGLVGGARILRPVAFIIQLIIILPIGSHKSVVGSIDCPFVPALLPVEDFHRFVPSNPEDEGELGSIRSPPQDILVEEESGALLEGVELCCVEDVPGVFGTENLVIIQIVR